ncbi:3-dehydroquinate synthase [Planctomycetales bacterium 10988]|nr:3-dehydroquinate synthase [Planctomycetales bacterium 10988]
MIGFGTADDQNEEPAWQTLPVELADRSYPIVIGTQIFAEVGEIFAQACPEAGHVVVMTDENLEETLGYKLCESLAENDLSIDLLVIPAGEASKCVELYGSLLEQMADLGADRKTVMIALGGGVIGDLAGFVAASYTRGIPFVQIPTSLLAQVDSSVGGKVGINLPQAKNMVGAFWQPKAVIIDTEVLNSLPEREYRAGLAEVVKYGVILDEEFFAYLESHLDEIQQREAHVLQHIIRRSCELKADVVREDERETTGLRAILNYGHTFGHAFERLADYEDLVHGEAVSIGMILASRYAERRGMIDAEVTKRQYQLLAAIGLPTKPPSFDPSAILKVMQKDKKNELGSLRLILPTRLGHVELVKDVAQEDLLNFLEEMAARST